MVGYSRSAREMGESAGDITGERVGSCNTSAVGTGRTEPKECGAKCKTKKNGNVTRDMEV